MHVSQIWVYPIKSCAGVSVRSAKLGERGLAYDRHWMLVDSAGRALTLRESPRLTQIRPQLTEAYLEVSAPELPLLQLPYRAPGEVRSVRLFGSVMDAVVVAEATPWFSRYLGRSAELVYVADTNTRVMREDFGTQHIRFVDGNPVNLLSAASLDDLNTRLTTAASVENFRPNLVICGTQPYAEDTWRQIRIGSVTFRVYEACQRCMVVNIDPESGAYRRETLAALARYRRSGNAVLFGQNLSYHGEGTLAVGDKLEVLTGVHLVS